jgi:hypothetical protein
VTERYIFRVNVSGDTEWRWADPSGQQRLVRTDELRAALASGTIAPNTPVWRQGWKEWRPATEVPELTASALSAANGIVPNIPPPPMAVVAAQHQFEGEPVPTADKSKSEPPPPPRYVPTATRPLHTPSQPMRVPVSLTSGATAAPHYSVSANTAVNIRALNSGDADALVASPAPQIIDLEPPTKRPNAGEPQPPAPDDDQLKTLPHPIPSPAAPLARPAQNARPTPKVGSAPPPPPPSKHPLAMGIAKLVRSSTPPPMRGQSSRPPPPPKSSKPPPPRGSKPPPRAEDAGKEVIEELSGSVLLADQSASQNAIEELSGSVLLADQSGSIKTVVHRDKSGALLLPDLSGPAPAMPANAGEELSGNFLLDAGSTGALPSVESTGRILAAKAASRAPFAPIEEAAAPPAAGASPEGRIDSPSSAPIVPLALPLGSTPPPPPSHLMPAPTPAPAPNAALAAFAAPPAQTNAQPQRQLPSKLPTLLQFQPQPAPSEPFMVQPGAVTPEVPALATLVGVPPPPDHALAEAARSQTPQVGPYREGGDLPLPPPERSTARLHDFRAMGHDPRARYVLAAFGAFGLLAFVGIVGLIIGAFRKKAADEPTAATTALSASAAPSATAGAKVAPAAAATVAPAPLAGTPGAPCTLAGAAHVIAPRAIVQSGVETTIVGSRLAVGFASREKEGYAVAIDPSSAIATQTVRVRAADAIRRLVPIEGARGLAAAADGDRHSDFLGGRRTVPATHPFDLGFGGGGLAWAPYRSSEVDLIWTLEGDDPVEAVRAAPLDPSHEDTGWAIAFRRGEAIYAGAVSGGPTLTPKGPLVKIAGLGPQVGSPTVAAQDGAVLVAWADRGQPSEPWSLRWMRFAPGDASAEAKGFVPSEGGLGEHAMSPAIAAAGQGRFVMAWTEGPVSNHQVRAQTITGSGAPLGTAMGISDSGVNAGQAQLAILPDGHGVVAYLASSGTGPKASYEVLATPIVCP